MSLELSWFCFDKKGFPKLFLQAEERWKARLDVEQALGVSRGIDNYVNQVFEVPELKASGHKGIYIEGSL